MKNYISTAEVAIWIVLIAARVVLCLSIFKKRLFERMPLFSVYAAWTTAQSITLFAVAFLASYNVYYYVFYVTSHLGSLLAFLTLIECGRRVLPGLDLPQKQKALSLLLASVSLVTIFVSFWPMWYVEKRIESGAYLCVAIAFIFITVYSRYLGLYWSRLVAGISSSLGFLYLLQGIAKAMMGHYPPTTVLLIRQISQIANVLAVIAWIVVVLSPWGESVMTEEDLQILETAFAKIEDSLGTERIKIV
jgi:hypothetical protein